MSEVLVESPESPASASPAPAAAALAPATQEAAVESQISTAAPAPTEGKVSIAPTERMQMIAEAAYYHAEKRGFAPGGELVDWFEAEAEIERCFEVAPA